MKKFLYPFILTWILAIISCSKEKSCEGCIGGNKQPIALAGPDQVITLPTDSALLDGSTSSDPDGTISEWLWKKIAGPASFTIANQSNSRTSVRNLVFGSYLFELLVKDNNGLTATDTVRITVDSTHSINRPPIANAGVDQTITLPVNATSLDGSNSTDPDNNITSYLWTKISGPSSFIIVNTTASQTQVNNLVQGEYQFELKVTDAVGLFSRDTMKLTVVLSQPQPCLDCNIVFVSNRDGNSEIYSCKADGSNIIRLTNNNASDERPTWSPDGSRIAFISNRTGVPELFIMHADGSNVVQITLSALSGAQYPTWSPDGTKIAYSTVSNGSSNIWVVSVPGGSQSVLFEAQGYEAFPAWSPNGTKIALASDFEFLDNVSDIYTINADGTGFTVLTDNNILDGIDYNDPAWSPDGGKLAMKISPVFGFDPLFTQIGVINSNGTGLAVIMTGTAPATRISWSSDGNRIAYTSLSGSRMDISWVSIDGSSSGTIVTNGWDADWKH